MVKPFRPSLREFSYWELADYWAKLQLNSLFRFVGHFSTDAHEHSAILHAENLQLSKLEIAWNYLRYHTLSEYQSRLHVPSFHVFLRSESDLQNYLLQCSLVRAC